AISRTLSFLLMRPQPRSPLFPYTTLFRSEALVKTLDLAGEVAIMARYQGQVATFRSTIPLGADLKDVPAAKNAIDVAVLNKLKRSEEHTSELQSREKLVCRLLLEKKKQNN